MQNETPINQIELEASLTRLGIRELEERMEISPLLLLGEGDTVDQMDSICCTCKIPYDLNADPKGLLPFPQIQEDLLAPFHPGIPMP